VIYVCLASAWYNRAGDKSRLKETAMTPITNAETQTAAPVPPANALPNPSLAERLSAIERRKNDPAYIARQERLFAEAEEYRRAVNAEERRRLDEAEGK